MGSFFYGSAVFNWIPRRFYVSTEQIFAAASLLIALQFDRYRFNWLLPGFGCFFFKLGFTGLNRILISSFLIWVFIRFWLGFTGLEWV